MRKPKTREKYLLFFQECYRLQTFKLGDLRREWGMSTILISAMSKSGLVSRTTKTIYCWQGGLPSLDLVDAVRGSLKDYNAIKKRDSESVPNTPPPVIGITDLSTTTECRPADLFNPQITDEQAIAHLKAQGCYRIIKTTEIEV